MKAQIEQQLQQLVGLRLTTTTRAANMECLKFGHATEISKTGQEIEVGKFSLHIQSPWRITDKSKILVGSVDLYEPVDENTDYDENFDWDKAGANLRDIRLRELIEQYELVVVSVMADNFGGFDLLFNNGITLTVFPAESRISEYAEFWRLLNKGEKGNLHFVVSNAILQQDRNDF